MNPVKNLLSPWSNVGLPKEFILDAPPGELGANVSVLWGPLAITIPDANSFSQEELSKWLIESQNFILYLSDVTEEDGPALWEWCTNREHLFEPNCEPRIEDGILKCDYIVDGTETLRSLWFRPLTDVEWKNFLGVEWERSDRGERVRRKYWGNL